MAHDRHSASYYGDRDWVVYARSDDDQEWNPSWVCVILLQEVRDLLREIRDMEQPTPRRTAETAGLNGAVAPRTMTEAVRAKLAEARINLRRGE